MTIAECEGLSQDFLVSDVHEMVHVKENLRMAALGSDLWRPPTSMSQLTAGSRWIREFRAVPSWILSICKDGDATASQGNIFPHPQ